MDTASDFDTFTDYSGGNFNIDIDAAMEQHRRAVDHTSTARSRWLTALVGAGIAGYGLSQRSSSGVALAAVGGGIAYLGATGKLPSPGGGAPGGDGSVRVERAITIAKPADELFSYWRNLENLPRVMTHLEAVRDTGDGQSHWVAKAPLGKTVEWDAEIINEEPSRFIAWRSLEGSDIQNTGAVRFEQAPGGRGTELRVRIEYLPPAGIVGQTVAKLLGGDPSVEVWADLKRFKALMETGEAPTTAGQPRGDSSGSLLGAMSQKARETFVARDETLGGPAGAVSS